MESIKFLRKKKGILQKDIAKQLNVAVSTVSAWENGVYEIDFNNLNKLADFFDVTIDELLGRVPEQRLFDDSRIDRPEILELLDQMTPAEQMSVVSYARGILSSRDLRSDTDSRFYKTNA